MLERVVLTNFQAHKSLDLKLGKFTTLTGGSNGGKSAVLRAIIALVRNDSASHYVRHGQSSLSVKLFFADGHQIEWVKGASVNRYILTLPNGADKVFDKVGANVPEEVKEVLKLGPVLLGNGDKEYVNFHQQLEQPFLISSTPGDVAKLFGELTSASQLYSAVGEGNRSMRNIKGQKTTRMGDLRQAKVALETFDDLPEQESLLSKAREHLQRAKDLEERAVSLTSFFNDYTDIQHRKKELGELQTELSPALTVSLGDLNRLESLSKSILDLKKDIERIDWLENALQAGQKSVSYLQGAIKVNLSPLKEVQKKLADLETDAMLVQSAYDRVSELQGKVSECEQTKLELDRLMSELLESMQSCPSCKQLLSEEAKKELLKSGYESYAAH